MGGWSRVLSLMEDSGLLDMKSTSRCVRVGFLGTALVAVASACSGGDGREVLIVYSPHGSDMLSHFEARFEARNPTVDVQYIDMGSQEVLDRVRSERANPQADVWWGAPSEIFSAAADDGLLEAYRPSWADALPADAQGGGDLWFGTYLTPEVIAYNEDAVSREDAPKDWDDVLDPRWRGEVLIREPMASGTMRAIFGSIIYREIQRTGSPDSGYEWLLRLDAQTKEYALNPPILYQKLARQEGLITLWDMPDIETLRATTDFPINYVLPASGTPVVIDAIGVVAGTRNPELARAFVDFAGSEESLNEAAEQFFRIPARSDLDPEGLPQWLQDALPQIIPMPIDRDVFSAQIRDWMRYWDDNIRRRGADAGF